MKNGRSEDNCERRRIGERVSRNDMNRSIGLAIGRDRRRKAVTKKAA